MEKRLDSLEATEILGADPAMGSAGEFYSEEVRIVNMLGGIH